MRICFGPPVTRGPRRNDRRAGRGRRWVGPAFDGRRGYGWGFERSAVRNPRIARENLAAALSSPPFFRPLLRGAASGLVAGSPGSALRARRTRRFTLRRPVGPKRPVPRPIAAFVGVFHRISFRRRASRRTPPALVFAVGARLAAAGGFTKPLDEDSSWRRSGLRPHHLHLSIILRIGGGREDGCSPSRGGDVRQDRGCAKGRTSGRDRAGRPMRPLPPIRCFTPPRPRRARRSLRSWRRSPGRDRGCSRP